MPLAEMSPVEAAKKVTIPTFLYQVRDDLMTRSSDVQEIYDNIPEGVEKQLDWIEGSTRRWDGYTHFRREPARVLEWLDC